MCVFDARIFFFSRSKYVRKNIVKLFCYFEFEKVLKEYATSYKVLIVIQRNEGKEHIFNVSFIFKFF